MAQSIARLPAPIHQLREKLQRLLRKPLASVFENADDALFELADNATNNQEQNLYFESMREVRLRRRKLEQGFWVRIDKGFAGLLQQTGPQETYEESQGSLDDLTLVEHEELERQVAVEAMATKAMEASADTVQQISVRLSALVPAKVYVSNNPVGPEALCKAFAAEVDPLDIDIKAQLVVLKLFDKYVLSQSAALLSTLNQLLIDHNVLPSLTTRQPVRRQAAPAPQTGAGMSGMDASVVSNQMTDQPAGQAGSVEANTQVLEQLRGLLGAVQGSGQMQQATGQTAVPQIPLSDVLSVLGRIQHQQNFSDAQQAALLAPGKLQGVIEGNLSREGLQKLRSVDQDVINLVNMLFEFILEDRNLPVPMKALLARLQIPMLKVAIADKTFFNKGTHPARRLLNELATAALGWQEPEDHDSSKRKDPLYRQVESTIHRLLESFESDVGIFDELLTEFLAFIDKERRRASILERRTLDAEDGKAKAEAARGKVAELMTEKIGGLVLPDVVGELLEGPWSNALFLICLKQGQDSEEWLHGVKVVDDLLWSVTVQVDGQQRTRLIKLLPDLLQRLRKGLEQISYNPFEMTKLLKRLEKVHLLQLKGPQAKAAEPAPVPASSTSPAAKVDSTGASAIDSTAAADSATSAESKTAKAAPTVKVEASALPETKVVTKAGATKATVAKVSSPTPIETKAPEAKAQMSAEPKATAKADEKFLNQVDKLTQGCWFEMTESEDNRYRCRLAAIIKNVDKYIFVNRNGMKVAEKGRADLALAMQTGTLRQLDDGMLFDRALESVIGNLRQAKSGL